MERRRTVIPVLLAALLLVTGSILANPKKAIPPEVYQLLAEGKIPEGILKARSLLAQAESEYGTDSLEVADAAQNLSLILSLVKVGDKAERIALAERAVETKRNLLASRDPSLAAALYVLGQAYYQAYDYPGSVPHFRNALAIIDDYFGPHHHDALVYVREYGSALHQTGAFAGALGAFRRQAIIAEDAYGADAQPTLDALRNVALALNRLDQYAEAERILLRIIGILNRSEHPDQTALAAAQQSYSILLSMQGRFVEAIREGETALDLGRKNPDTEPAWLAQQLSNLANMLRKIGDLEMASRYLTESLAIQETAETDPALRLRAMMQLAMTEFDSGSPLPALEILRNAEAFARGSVPDDDLVWSPFYYYRALIHASAGDHDSAVSDFEKAASIRTDKGLQDDFDGAEILAGIGVSEMELGLLDDAIEHLSRASQTMEPITGRVHPAHIEVLDALALAHWRAQQVGEATTVGLEAARADYDLTRATVAGLPERQALAFNERGLSGDDVVIAAVLSRDHTLAVKQAAFDALIRSRAMVFDELVIRRRLLSENGDSATSKLVGELRKEKTNMANLFLADPTVFHRPYADVLEQARDRVESLERQLAAVSASLRPGRMRSEFDAQDLAAALPAGSASVSYFLYNDPGSKGVSRYLAVVQEGGKNSVPRFVDLGPARRIEPAIVAWRETLRPQSVLSSDVQGAERRYRETAENLRRLIWDPVSTLLSRAETVFIIPDGEIALVSFAAFPGPNGTYFIESGPNFHYLSTERDLSAKPSPTRSDGELLVIGSPTFNRNRANSRMLEDPESRLRSGASECSSLRGHSFSKLPETRKEAKSIRKTWESTDRSGRATLLLGADATESAFRALAGNREIIHLATHGYYLGDRCNDTDMKVRGIGGLSRKQSTAAPMDRRLTGNPLLYSGLAFAGANLRHGDARTAGEGILTAEEVATMDLDAVRLAVLSACRTGDGSVMTGEGVFGLQRAFLVAGVDSVVTNLWEVEDRAGREWVQFFYNELLVHGKPVATSATAASLAVIAARRDTDRSTHPFFWGGWLAVGDPN